ncbi:hypothetical protein [Evansella clarkii]|uniref:hypothetical protein n=1 Tax=Evansella clarkii TaxID=79879 RepID=UPI001473AB8E|nr:hypothetical protein [Evansella clarkii]
MNQTSKITCPACKKDQNEDIHDLTMDAGDMDGEFPHICEHCKKEFKVEFCYKPYVRCY